MTSPVELLPHRYSPYGPPFTPGGGDQNGQVLQSVDYAILTPEAGGDGGSNPPDLTDTPTDFADPTPGPLELGAVSAAGGVASFGDGFLYRARAVLPLVNQGVQVPTVVAQFWVDVTTGGVGAPAWIPAGPRSAIEWTLPAASNAPTNVAPFTLVALLQAQLIAVAASANGKILWRVTYADPGDTGNALPFAPPFDGPVGGPGGCSLVVERLAT